MLDGDALIFLDQTLNNITRCKVYMEVIHFVGVKIVFVQRGRLQNVFFHAWRHDCAADCVVPYVET